MQYRIDTKSGNKLSALGFGCMRLPGAFGNIDLLKAEAVIMEAIGQGVNFFDTAYLYPGSEAALGHVLAKNNVRDKVYIATKLPQFQCRAYEDFDKYFDIQLERLKTDYIDYYFMHNMARQEDWNRLCGLGIEKWIQEKRAQGKIKHVGFSFHGVKDEFTTLLDAYNWDFCMIQYNYVNVNYQAGVAGLKYAYSKGIPVFIMEPLLGGRLAKDLPEAATKLFAENGPEAKDVRLVEYGHVTEYRQKDSTATPAAWALRWLWNQPEVTLVLSGMNDIEQLKENAALAAKSQVGGMSEYELSVIEKVKEIFSSSYKIPCTGCNYCLPCPVNINIPDCFMAYNSSYAISRFAGMQQYATTSGGLHSTFSIAVCVKCGKCEKLCPQEIAIMERLADVYKRMEPWWYRVGVKIVRCVGVGIVLRFMR